MEVVMFVRRKRGEKKKRVHDGFLFRRQNKRE